MRKELDAMVNSLHPPRPNTGLVVGVIERGHRSIIGYGSMSQAHPEPPAGNTLFEIGSITKVFTTTLLSLMAADGFVHWDNPVRDLVPELSNLPPEITLLRLATHTSGLPHMPANVIPSTLRNRGNPYATYTAEDMIAYLSSYRPRHGPKSPEQMRYSNLGLSLLGYALARRLGFSYEEAVVDRICRPLDLPDTRITLTAQQQARLAPPHAANGRPRQNWDLPAFAGAGALRSTANDMLTFLAANLGDPPIAWADVMQHCHEIQSEAAPPQGRWPWLARLFQKEPDPGPYRTAMALGWFVGRLAAGDRPVHWHHGATGGYRTFVGLVKTTGTGIVVLANRGPARADLISNTTSADRVGFRVLEYLNVAGNKLTDLAD